MVLRGDVALEVDAGVRPVAEGLGGRLAAAAEEDGAAVVGDAFQRKGVLARRVGDFLHTGNHVGAVLDRSDLRHW